MIGKVYGSGCWGIALGCVVVLGMAPRVSADAVSGEIFPLQQPDGTSVEVRLWGDEFYHIVESLDGYTLVRDPDTGFGCYARLSSDGNELVSTGITVGSPMPGALGIGPHLRVNRAAAEAKIAEARARVDEDRAAVLSKLGPDFRPASSTQGNVQGIVLLVDFSDQPATILPSEISNYCNQIGYTGYGNNGSVRDYFYDVSDGHLTYTNFVPTGYYRANNPKSWYDNSSVPCCSRARTLVLEALNDLNSHGFDFSQYDSNGDGLIDAVNVFYAGTRNGPWAYGLWPHSGWISFSADGVSTGPYQMTDIGTQLRLRTFCHENGHMVCSFPDLYDYGYESNGVGNFCLMCYGASDTNPCEPCAYLKNMAGWADTTLLTTPQTGLTVTAGINTIFKYQRPSVPNEYYLIENRRRSGRDANIPDQGLAIWHVDEYGSNDWEQMTAQYHYECTLVQADGLWELEHGYDYGDSNDLWGAPSSTECTPDTNPNTNWWNGSSSNLFVTEISAPGSTMTFTFRNTWDCNGNGIADGQDIAGGFSADNNGNGIPDECECAWIAASAQPESTVVAKGRYLTFLPANAGEQTALRVRLIYLPPPFDGANGTAMWVGALQDISEDPGSSGSAPPTFKGAALTCAPVYTDWGAVGLLHVYSDAVVPGAEYAIQAINEVCNPIGEPNYSQPLAVATSTWGDLVGDDNQQPPNGTVNFNDISAIVDKFKNLPGAPSKARVDLAPDTPDRIIDFVDIPAVVDAFKGRPFPYHGPSGCP